MKISVFAQRLPEHVVVEQHLLVVIEADRTAPALSGDHDCERQEHVPAQRQDAVEEEDRERRQQEAGDERHLARALAPPPAAGRSAVAAVCSALRWVTPAFSSRAHAPLGVGQRGLGVLAAEHGALELRPERVLDPAVVAAAASCRTSCRCARAGSSAPGRPADRPSRSSPACALSTALLPVRTLAARGELPAAPRCRSGTSRSPRRARDSSSPWRCRGRGCWASPSCPASAPTPSVSALIHGPLPLIQKKAGEWACSMPTLPVAKALVGLDPAAGPGDLVDGAALGRLGEPGRATSAALGVLKVGFLRSGDSSSTPFICISGQYSQSKLSVSKPGLLAALDLVGGGEDLVEALRRPGEARLLEACVLF